MIRFVAIMIATENGISEKEIVKSKSSENECNEAAAKTIPNNIESKAESWATQLLKVRIALDQAKSLTAFAEILAKQLVRILKCRNVFVGICKRMGEVDLVGIESDDFSSESSLEVVRNAAREVALGQVCVGWPRNNRWSPSLVHRELVSAAHSTAFSVAIRAGDGDVMGIVTVVITENNSALAFQQLDPICQLLAPQMEFQRQHAISPWKRCLEYATGNTTLFQRWLVGISAALLLGMIPIPHRISCDAEVNPMVRRFVAAPFEGILRSSAVSAGDLVAQGQMLASLDEDEMRLQVSSISAEEELARKTKASALANGEALEAQQAKLELRKLTYKRELLTDRSDSLILHSPIDGVVLKSELEDAEGAPLTKGQVLFEIAPLEKVKIKVFISQQDVAFVSEGMDVIVSVDSISHKLVGTLNRIQPQSDTFENESVFVAEVEFENRNNELKPGMQGYAVVVSEFQPIGWILFHKPARYFKRLAGF